MHAEGEEMTTLHEAAQQALEALYQAREHVTVHTDGTWQQVENDCHAAIAALRAALAQEQAEPVLQTCNCRWDGNVQVQQCTLHEAHVDAIHEWAERAKTAEKKLAALAQEQAEPTGKQDLQVEPAQEPVATTQQPVGETPPSDYRRGYWDGFAIGKREGRIEAEDAAKQTEPKGGGNLPPPLRTEPTQEPVAWRISYPDDPELGFWFAEGVGGQGCLSEPLYTAPPRRTMVSLTEEEAAKACGASGNLGPLMQIVRAIERAHGIGEQP